MADFIPDKHSRITGKARGTRRPPGPRRPRKFKVYRYDPDSGENPRYDSSRSISTTAGRWCSTR